MNIFRNNPLFFSFLFPMLVDSIFTLLGQGEKYWRNFNMANEMSPVYFLLAIHPIVYIAGVIIWFFCIYWIFRRLKNPFNVILASTF